MNITGAHVRIRPTRHDDLPFLQTLWNDGEVMRHYGFPNGMGVTAEGMEQWWSMTPQGRTQRADGPLAAPHSILELLDGTSIGELAYSVDAHRRARLDLKLARAYWRQGLAAEALQLALRELFTSALVGHRTHGANGLQRRSASPAAKLPVPTRPHRKSPRSLGMRAGYLQPNSTRKRMINRITPGKVNVITDARR
ncbi:MAG: GNAT family N-acetyltransferase [Armatimonadota bacterium]